ncbi:hypothetical protein SAMN04487981_105357 [Streptomyces sp. cf386]|uniref:hypothetical protein n=1 Tax=Streptomyces sp. cf386 TaxID=1761904 RepID=UPI000886949D|nr:hypothetical protein [Streptomyces sp. cf386]SDN53308.1 hypothetical protein SAMN04487981_105357 [Streptomyces sp. cf386]
MARISVDYDLMYVLARQIWHLRDELDVSSQTDRDFAAGDIGPRRDTAEELTNFYGAWQKSFREAWQVMTDLGNLLDEIGKAFYDQDAGTAANASTMAASYLRQNIKAENDAYKQRQDAMYKRAEAANLERRHKPGQLYLQRQQEEHEKKRAALEKEQEAQAKRQEGFIKQQEALQKEQEPLRQRQDELDRRQQELWEQQKAEREEQESAFAAKQEALNKEAESLRGDQEPLRQQQDELQRKQQELWQEEKDLRHAQEALYLAQQAALQQQQDAYDAKSEALTKKQEALWKERDALMRKKGVTQGELDAWQKKQDALWAEQDALWEKEGEPLQKKWDDLDKLAADQEKAFDPLQARQEALDKQRQALADQQEPFGDRAEELQRKQEGLWKEQDAARKTLDGEQDKEQGDLDREKDALQKEQDAFAPKWDELDKQQEALWKDQAANEEAQKQLDKEEEPLRRQAEDMQKSWAADQEELAKKPAWTPESGEPNPLNRNRELGGQGPSETPPPPVPNGYERDDENGHTKVEYKLDANGQIEVDKNGNPVETTVTITNKNGLTYRETYRTLSEDGDSVTTTHRSDGTVSKVYLDVDPGGYDKGFMKRYVTDENGDTQQIWTKAPDGDWVLNMDKETYFNSEAGQEDPQKFLDRPPAYLTVEKPLVDAGGHLADGTSAQGTTTTLPDGNTRTDYTRSDGSVLRVVTTDMNRYVADGSGEIQEIWQKNQDGTWYLRDSITQHQRYGDEPPLGTLGENWR